MIDTPERQDVFRALAKAVCDGLEIVRKVEAQNITIDRHDFYPSLSYLDPGFPRFSFARTSEKIADVPKDYRTIFKDYPSLFDEYKIKDGSLYLTNEIPSWQEFRSFVQNDSYLKKYLGPGYFWKRAFEAAEKTPVLSIDMKDFLDRHTTFGCIRSLLDRYIQINKSTEYDESSFKPIYLQWERGIFDKRLTFDILVPIIRLKFDFEDLPLDDSVALERIADGLQLSRGHKRSSDMSAHDDVITAATHALVLKNWSIENGETREDVVNTLNDLRALSTAILNIEKFIAALRAATGAVTGYCQILLRPIDWADHWEADLPCLHLVSKRSYPEQLEKVHWSDPAPVLSAERCLAAGRLYAVLTQTSNNRLTLAAKRLNAASLRSDEEDSIMDITIALEALLGDEGKGEMTHKLATRLAALCRIEKFKEYTSAEVFGFCKKIYAFRSAVAHGAHELGKSRVMKIEEEKIIPTVELGLELLGFSLRVLSENQKYLNPHELDLFLVS
jgi:hypothetical protein